jgi:hypothetical protein
MLSLLSGLLVASSVLLGFYTSILLIIAEKTKFSETMLNDSTLLRAVVYMFPIIGRFRS